MIKINNVVMRGDRAEVTVTFGKITKTFDVKLRTDPNTEDPRGRFEIPVGARVGRTGVKIWCVMAVFGKKSNAWSFQFVSGGINGKPLTPVAFWEDIPESMKSGR